MDKDLIKLLIELGLAVVAFILGRYILPKYKGNIQTAVSQFEFILKYAESFCAYARQFLTTSGEEKMDEVVKKLKELCVKEGIQVEEETLRAIAQKAYDAMVAAENKAKIVIESPAAIEEVKTFEPVEAETTEENK